MSRENLRSAIDEKNVDKVRAILSKNKDLVYEVDEEECSDLHYACTSSEKCPEIIKVLLDCDYDVNLQNSVKETPLFNICYTSRNITDTLRTEIVKILLDHGADPRICDVNGATALEYVKSKKIARMLLIGEAMLRLNRMFNLTDDE